MPLKIVGLKKKKDFDFVFKSGPGSSTSAATLKCVRTNQSFIRIGVVVGLKVSKKAVIRNKIRRRIKAIFREGVRHVNTGIDCVFFVKPPITAITFNETNKHILYLLNKLPIINKR